MNQGVAVPQLTLQFELALSVWAAFRCASIAIGFSRESSPLRKNLSDSFLTRQAGTPLD